MSYKIYFIWTMAVDQLSLVKKQNFKSVAWDYFGVKVDKDGKILTDSGLSPACRICHKSVLCKGGNTSNLFTHLSDSHPTLF